MQLIDALQVIIILEMQVMSKDGTPMWGKVKIEF